MPSSAVRVVPPLLAKIGTVGLSTGNGVIVNVALVAPAGTVSDAGGSTELGMPDLWRVGGVRC